MQCDAGMMNDAFSLQGCFWAGFDWCFVFAIDQFYKSFYYWAWEYTESSISYYDTMRYLCHVFAFPTMDGKYPHSLTTMEYN